MKERIKWIDFAKGFGIIIVAMAHMGTFGSRLIYLFQMPYFFMLSGLLFSDKKTEYKFISYIRYLSKRLLWPYLTFGIVGFFFWGGVLGFSPEFAYIHFTSLFYGNVIHSKDYVGPIWFLSALFTTQTLYFAITRYFNEFKTIIIVALVFIGLLFNGNDCLLLPFHLELACVALGFFYIGYWMNNKKIFERLSAIYKICISVIFIAMGMGIGLYNQNSVDKINMLKHVYGNPFLFFASASFISIGLILFWNCLSQVIEKECAISYIGANSLFYMATHFFVINIIYIVCNNFHIAKHGLPILVICLAVCTILNEITKRFAPFLIKYPFDNQ